MSDSPYIIEITAENFGQVVLEGSRQVPVLIDFWASWCQPCKILLPVLTKLAEEYAGKFILAKLNTEEQQELAVQFGIRSIPTLKLFKNGQSVDEFSGALPEDEIRKFLDQHIPRESDTQVEAAKQQLLQGDGLQALETLSQAQREDPRNTNILIAMAQTQAALGKTDDAQEILDSLPATLQEQSEISALRSHLFFDAIAAQAASMDELRSRLTADENDSEARYQLAVLHTVHQDYAEALENLLILLQKDRQYNDDAARTTMLRLFELLDEDPLVARYRGKMASMLY